MKCPVCSRAVHEGSSFCSGCGAALLPAEQATLVLPAGAEPPSPLPPRYRMERLLGEGGMKRVYLAMDTQLGRRVAIGLVRREGLDDQGRARLKREARAMARLGNHPNIVGIFDILEHEGRILIVVPYLPGGSVEQRMRERGTIALELAEALRIAEQVVAALAYAHAQGIIHRDLKPANVWLTEDGTAQLGDFGLAAVMDESRLTQPGMMLGTLAYMAPEQSTGRPPAPAADLYSLGVMLYEWIAGRRPFQADDAMGLISQHLHADPVPPSQFNPAVPAELDRLVLRLLAKFPENRPVDAAAAAVEIQEVRAVIAAGGGTPAAEAQLPPATGWSPFVGRREELDRLKTALEGAFQRRGGMLLLVGEPGIGKSRLTEEFKLFARFRGALALTGHCYEGEGALPFLPIVECLREYLSTQSADAIARHMGTSASDLARLTPEIRHRLPHLPESPRLEGDAERLRLYEAWCDFVFRAAADRPLVVVLEDLHWSDKSSLLLLLHWARRVRTEPILIVGTYRDVDLDRTHPLAEMLGRLNRERLFERVPLKGLSESDVQLLVNSVSQQEAPSEFIRLLSGETEGNPFFLEEILRHLVEAGLLVERDGRWSGDPAAIRENLPEGVRDVIGRRLARLSEDCNALLTSLSAVAGGAAFELILALEQDRSEEALLDLLDEALAARILRERREGASLTYDFTHALIRQTLYSELSTPRRARLHRRIAETLERVYASSLEGHAADLAEHYYHASVGGSVEKAIHYASLAAERAFEVAAFEQAITFLRRGVEVVEQQSEEHAAAYGTLLVRLGEAINLGGDPGEARRIFSRALAIAEQLGSPELAARAALGGTELSWVPGQVNPFNEDLLRRALVRLGDSASMIRVETLMRMHQEYFLAGKLDEAIALQQTAADIAARLGDPVSRAVSRPWLGAEGELSSTLLASYLEVRIPDYEAILATQATGHLHDLLKWLLAAHHFLGEFEAAQRVVDQIGVLAERTRSPYFRASHACLVSLGPLCRGEFAAAEPLVHAAIQMVTQSGLQTYERIAKGRLIDLRRLQGRLSEVLPLLDTDAPEANYLFPYYQARNAMAFSEMGRVDEAGAILSWFVAEGLTGLDIDTQLPRTLAYLADAAFRLGREEIAPSILELGQRLADLCVSIGGGAIFEGAFSRSLGAMAALLDRIDEAASFFEDAMARNERTGARPWLAIGLWQYAWTLLRRGAPGDAERARDLAARARELATAIGMKKLLADLDALRFPT